MREEYNNKHKLCRSENGKKVRGMKSKINNEKLNIKSYYPAKNLLINHQHQQNLKIFDYLKEELISKEKKLWDMENIINCLYESNNKLNSQEKVFCKQCNEQYEREIILLKLKDQLINQNNILSDSLEVYKAENCKIKDDLNKISIEYKRLKAITDEESYKRIYREIKENERIIAEYQTMKLELNNLMGKYKISRENTPEFSIKKIDDFIGKIIKEIKNEEFSTNEKADNIHQSVFKNSHEEVSKLLKGNSVKRKDSEISNMLEITSKKRESGDLYSGETKDSFLENPFSNNLESYGNCKTEFYTNKDSSGDIVKHYKYHHNNF